MITEIIITIIGILAIFKSIFMLRKRKLTLALSLFWIVLWTLAIIAVNVPQFNRAIIELLGRDASMILFLNILILYYLSLILYIRINKNKEEITKLVREVALKNGKK